MREGLTTQTIQRWYVGAGGRYQFLRRDAPCKVIDCLGSNQVLTNIMSDKGSIYERVINITSDRLRFDLKGSGAINLPEGDVGFLERKPVQQWKEGITPDNSELYAPFNEFIKRRTNRRVYISSLTFLNALLNNTYYNPHHLYHKIVTKKRIAGALSEKWYAGLMKIDELDVYPRVYLFRERWPIGAFNGKEALGFKGTEPFKEEIEGLGIQFDVIA